MESISVDEILLICDQLNKNDLTMFCKSSLIIGSIVSKKLLQMLKNLCLLIDNSDFTESAIETWNRSNLQGRINSYDKIKKLFFFSNHIKSALKFLNTEKPTTKSLFHLISHAISCNLFLTAHFYISWFEACKLLIKNLNYDYFEKKWKCDNEQRTLYEFYSNKRITISTSDQLTIVCREFSPWSYLYETFEPPDETAKRIDLLLKHFPSTLKKHSYLLTDLLDHALVCSSIECLNQLPLYLKNSTKFGPLRSLYLSTCIRYEIKDPPAFHCKIKGMTSFETKMFLIGTMGMTDDQFTQVKKTVVPVWKQANQVLKNKFSKRKDIADAFQIFNICHYLTAPQISQRTSFIFNKLIQRIDTDFFYKWSRNLIVEPSSEIICNELGLCIPSPFMNAAEKLCRSNNAKSSAEIYLKSEDFQFFQIDCSVIERSKFSKMNYSFSNLAKLRNDYCDLSSF